MSSKEVTTKHVDVAVENVGGIERTQVSFEPGVTILSGRNASNRTSLLQAIMAAHGSTRASVKADAERGAVELSIDDEHYECQLTRQNGSVSITGDPYLEDTEVADLFAFLLESNDARRAVARGDDLRDVIMRPVDTDQIQADIRDLEADKEQLDDRLEELDELERRLPELEAERTQLEDRLEAKRSELDEKETELDEADASVEEKRQAKDELESKLEELREARSSLEDARYKLETERDALESLESERADLEEKYEELPETPSAELDRIETRLEDLHDRTQTVTADLNQLQTIIQFNEEMLSDGHESLLATLAEDSSDGDGGSITDQLVDDERSVTCWTCGTTVAEDSIEEMVEELRAFRQRKLEEKRELDAEIEELQSEKQDIERKRQNREQLAQQLEEYEGRIARTEGNVEDLETRVEDLEEDVTELEAAVEELEQHEHSELLDRHKEVSQLEFEIETLEDELAEVDDEIDSVTDRLDERSALEERREEVQSELEELRTTVDRLERESVEEFNDHMEDLISELGFENLERVWLERVERETRDGRRTVSKTEFDLHVVRKTADGSVYEDTIDHLSESEREVVGLVFSLAGYLVHDVHETVPFMLLDSLEAIDGERIAALVEYFADFADYLVVALLPEDAAALDDEYTRITEI